MNRPDTSLIVTAPSDRGSSSGHPTVETGDGAATGDAGGALFTRLLLASTDPANLAEHDPAALAAHAEAALRFIGDKPRGEARVAVHDAPALGPGARPGTLIEIVNDDMPFLLDSVLGELKSRGLVPALILHPIFKTQRTAAGALEAVTAPGDHAWGDGRQESYISVHLDRLAPETADAVATNLASVLAEVRIVVADWRLMLDRVTRARRDLDAAPASVPADARAEAIAFLDWLVDQNFTFLGARDYVLVGDPATGELEPVPGAGLGMLRDPARRVLRRGRELVAMTPEVRRFFFSSDPLIISKANVQARVHRRVHMDYVGVKLYGPDGAPRGELRVVGLFTASAYSEPPARIPVLRRKVATVIEAFGAPPASHAGKALINVLDTFPRDELFQIDGGDLERWAAGILDLDARPRVRAFLRTDRFDRFVSALVYVPRDRFNTGVRERIAHWLAERFDGTIAAFHPSFGDGPLVRVHFIVARFEGTTPQVTEAEVEAAVRGIAATWEDRLAAVLAERPELAAKYAGAFPAGYADDVTSARALEDIERIERLGPERPVAIDFYREAGGAPGRIRAAIYRLDAPIRLSERVPVLENLGFSVIDERSWRITPRFPDGRREVVLHDMALETVDGSVLEIGRDDMRLEDCFVAVLRGQSENDGFNRLVLAAGCDWREAAILRAAACYLRQLGSTFGLRYIAETLVRHAGLARDLLEVFALRFNPATGLDQATRDAAAAPVLTRIEGALAKVPSLDEDRILRQVLAVLQATVRTNFYQRTAAGTPPETIAFKIESRRLDLAPAPKPFREIWVWSPRVEGVHLRFAPIARGGIRWSDRAQDFRTEVLGLAKAQQVKNAVIVPAGAKGGFVPKLLPRAGTREEVQAEGIAAYKIFISALLDITDNVHEGAIVPPPQVVRHDGDDPYLVVAADKGTATFSDIANGLSAAHGFWLGDAFASGGSAGYDHKGIAITARGAWECVKRHFREMDRDIQSQDFRVAGVGDMSGDVFGNAMLLSEHIRLVAAFDHRDIFLDPAPEPRRAHAERLRLFRLPRSSWADYDATLISKGGGVFPRSAKSIPLSAEVGALLGLEGKEATPAAIMRAILAADVDLLWFGGIGTYIRSTTETDQDVGDRANDALRITGAQVRAKVIGEGANLGVTQRGRLEAASRGVRLNTDFIDNSAGVNTSDQEVNIKIALEPAVRAGRLTLAARNALLKAMTSDVAQAVLRNNYQQSLALSLAERTAAADLGPAAHLIRTLEQRGILDRRLEALPGDRDLAERQRAGQGLARPELAVVLSYAKIALQHDLLASRVPDDPFLELLLVDYFPPALQAAWRGDLVAHRLKREIVGTTLTNGLVNRLGAPTPLRLADETARPISEVAYAFMAARSVFGLADLWRRLDALDGRIAGAAQLDLYARVRDLTVHATGTFLRDGGAVGDLAGTSAAEAAALAELRTALPRVATNAQVARMRILTETAEAQGVPADLAREIAELDFVRDAPAIARAARAQKASVAAAGCAWLEAGDRFHLDALLARAQAIRTADDYDRLAIAGALSAIADARSAITGAALAAGGTGLAAWTQGRADRVARAERELADIASPGDLTIARLAVAAARLTDLART